MMETPSGGASAHMEMVMVARFVVTKNNQPLKGVSVTINDSLGITNDKGEVQLDNIGLGKQTVYTYFNSETLEQKITIGRQTNIIRYENGVSSSQHIRQLSTVPNHYPLATALSVGTLLVLLVGIGLAIYAFFKHHKNRKKVFHKFYVRRRRSLFVVLSVLSILAIATRYSPLKQIIFPERLTFAADSTSPLRLLRHILSQPQ